LVAVSNLQLNLFNYFMKLEHIGIAVKSLGVSDELFTKLLGKES
jgi:methylmalonyl-CoA/ethylmalonyl-CoA epimerase